MKKKGKFIVIDGTNGSGKATQTELLKKHLGKNGYKIKVFDFPQYGEKSAALVEEYLNGKYGTTQEVGPYKASVFYACDRYAASFKLGKYLDEGYIVLSNRYMQSSMAHQAGQIKKLKEREQFLNWLYELEYGIFEIPVPDLILILHNKPKITQEWVDKKGFRGYVNGKKRDIHEADLKHLADASEGYKYICKKYKYPLLKADRKIEQVHEDIMKHVRGLLPVSR